MKDLKVGVYVDAENIKFNGGRNLRYDTLRKFAMRDGAYVVRMNTYLAQDVQREKTDRLYAEKQSGYFDAVRRQGWRIHTKTVKRFYDDEGNERTKANSDLDLAVDVLDQSTTLDKVILVSGDGDFSRMVTSLQNRGLRVEVMACDNVSGELKGVADDYYSAFAIPNLIPVSLHPEAMPDERDKLNNWGEIGSRVRGSIYHWNEDKGYGFFRYLKTINGGELWNIDHHSPDCPYGTCFVHVNRLSMQQQRFKDCREAIFEFTLRPGNEKGKVEADNIELIYKP